MTRDRPSDDPDDSRCRLCGDNAGSFEHVPPQAAGNATTAWMYGLQNWLTRDPETSRPGGRATIQQRGTGAYALCRQCNERAGSEYVPEFLKWVDLGNDVLRKLAPPVAELDATLDQARVTVDLERVQPGRFLKQAMTMLLAISPGGFPRDHPALVEFARDAQHVGLPDRYQLYLSLFAGPMARFVGGGYRLREVAGRGWVRDHVFEVAYPPFAYVLSIDETVPAAETGCISNFGDLRVGQTCDVELTLLIGFGHTALPLDYRSRAKVDADAEQARADAEEA